jgi:hypothetical protein
MPRFGPTTSYLLSNRRDPLTRASLNNQVYIVILRQDGDVV